MIKKQHLTILALVLVAGLGLGLNYPALAQEEPDASTPSATQALKDRIEKVVEEKKESVEKRIKENIQQKRGFIGRVGRVSEEAVTIESKQGSQIVPISDQVTIVKSGKEIEVADIAVENWATVLGLQLENDFEPLRIIIQEKSLRTDPQVVVLGTLVSNTSNKLTLRSRLDGQEYQFDLNRSTEYQDNQGEEVSLSDLFEEMQLLIVGLTETDQDDQTETNRAIVVRSLAPIEN
ncbi:MAG: hypothetical protein GF381_01730 [Candidatus Pacebacteria bacterium]|nr:hypothetical protein [Candidatus Paceibacterota bacterium]